MKSKHRRTVASTHRLGGQIDSMGSQGSDASLSLDAHKSIPSPSLRWPQLSTRPGRRTSIPAAVIATSRTCALPSTLTASYSAASKALGPSQPFVLTLENPKRFTDQRQIGAALGLAPRRDQSGGRVPNSTSRRLAMPSFAACWLTVPNTFFAPLAQTATCSAGARRSLAVPGKNQPSGYQPEELRLQQTKRR